MKKLGLIGFPLGHSFSKNYYLSKFEREEIGNVSYDLFPIEEVDSLKKMFLKDETFRGFNVTIPHKMAVIPLLDALSEEAQEIGAVNCVTITRDAGRVFLKGFNTDAYGFEASLRPLLKMNHQKALVLGNGGAAKAVFYVLRKLGIPFLRVSRSSENGDITYAQLDAKIVHDHQLIINCSPVGTFPNVEECPHIPYAAVTAQHLLYDLIYNPEETTFLKRGKEHGAMIKNGYEMLVLQAEKNWEIWQASFEDEK